MLKLGLCCCGILCCALIGGLLWFGGGAVALGDAVVAEPAKAGCAKQPPCAANGEAADVELTADERKVVAYLVALIEAGEPPMITDETLEHELGMSREAIEALEESKLRAGVMGELSRRNFDLAALGGNCAKYRACSVDRNLMNATGEELERYEAEVALDGTSFSDRIAPDFTLPTTNGRQVSLSDYRGQNVAVVFLSAHCYHSLDTLPILGGLQDKYASRGLTVLPVFVNSGDVRTLKSRAWEWDVTYPLLVSEDKGIAAAYDSRMVPSTFLIDEDGRLTKQLVGFKDQPTLDRALGELLGS